MTVDLQLSSNASAPGDVPAGPDARTGRPHTTFYRLIPEARLPQRADRSAAGTLPVRGARYCDAVTQASGFGWWLFPPISFSLLWDGSDVLWTWDRQDEWYPLADAAQFPGFASAFDEFAPEELRGCSPPFLTALPEPGHVQIWTGLMARTAPGWSLLIRPLANMPTRGGFALYEGIVETDRWFGPLFTNLRLTRTDQPVHFDAHFPLVMAQPLPRFVYDDAMIAAVRTVNEPAELTNAEWDDYRRTTVVPNEDRDRPFGAYAVAGRRRRKRDACPFAAGLGAATSA